MLFDLCRKGVAHDFSVAFILKTIISFVKSLKYKKMLKKIKMLNQLINFSKNNFKIADDERSTNFRVVLSDDSNVTLN